LEANNFLFSIYITKKNMLVKCNNRNKKRWMITVSGARDFDQTQK